ncbi:MAG TPA: hypothetical protein VEF33_03355 [Syntrophales bacterium]|nr:hypothetical protein [Syntrophales bacterium]
MSHRILVYVTLLMTVAGFLTWGAPSWAGSMGLITPPIIQVRLIAEDDARRNTGIMELCTLGSLNPTVDAAKMRVSDTNTCTLSGAEGDWTNVHSIYKFTVTANGQTFYWTTGSNQGPTVVCEVFLKHPRSPLNPEFPRQVLVTDSLDMSQYFICETRFKEPTPGSMESVGVLDLYYVGPINTADIGAYGVVVTALQTFKVLGVNTVVFGSDIQDLCVLGWPFNDAVNNVPYTLIIPTAAQPGGSKFTRVPDPLNGFTGCDDAVLFQRNAVGLTIPLGP